MKSFQINLIIYYYFHNNELEGLRETHVSNILRCADEKPRQRSKLTNTRSQLSRDYDLPFEFTRFAINQNIYVDVVIDENAYLRKLDCFPPDASFIDLRSNQVKLVWLANSFPDCLLEISQLAQVTKSM